MECCTRGRKVYERIDSSEIDLSESKLRIVSVAETEKTRESAVRDYRKKVQDNVQVMKSFQNTYMTTIFPNILALINAELLKPKNYVICNSPAKCGHYNVWISESLSKQYNFSANALPDVLFEKLPMDSYDEPVRTIYGATIKDISLLEYSLRQAIQHEWSLPLIEITKENGNRVIKLVLDPR
jgi:hypothetical protein